jgi:hypothetical protein
LGGSTYGGGTTQPFGSDTYSYSSLTPASTVGGGTIIGGTTAFEEGPYYIPSNAYADEAQASEAMLQYDTAFQAGDGGGATHPNTVSTVPPTRVGDDNQVGCTDVGLFGMTLFRTCETSGNGGTFTSSGSSGGGTITNEGDRYVGGAVPGTSREDNYLYGTSTNEDSITVRIVGEGGLSNIFYGFHRPEDDAAQGGYNPYTQRGSTGFTGGGASGEAEAEYEYDDAATDELIKKAAAGVGVGARVASYGAVQALPPTLWMGSSRFFSWFSKASQSAFNVYNPF